MFRRTGSDTFHRTPTAALPQGWEAQAIGLEELVLAYMREPEARAFPGPAAPDAELWEVRA